MLAKEERRKRSKYKSCILLRWQQSNINAYKLKVTLQWDEVLESKSLHDV